MEFSEVFCVLFSLALLQSVSGQFRFSNGRPVGNHNQTNLASPGRYLSCTTALRPCCSSSQGTWVRPSGVNVETSGSDVRQVHISGRDRYGVGQGRIDLYVTNSAMSGMYRCDIEKSVNVQKSFYVGLYLSSEGTIVILCLYNVFSDYR